MIPILILALTFAAGDTLRLDLDGAIDMALRNNLDYKIQALSKTSTKLSLAEGVSSYLPRPVLQASYSGYVTQFAGIIPWKGYLVDLSIRQPIFDFQKLMSVWGSKEDLDRSGAALEEAKNSLSYDVEYLYLSILKSAKTLEIQDDAIKRAEENLRLIEAKERLGQSSRLDALNARVTLNQAKLALANAGKDLKVTKRLLLNILGIRSSWEVILEPPREPDFQIELPPLDTLLALAFDQRPSLRSLQRSTTVANTEFWGQVMSFLPNISYRWSWEYRDENFPSPTEFADEALRGSGISAGLTFDPISYPLQVQKRKTVLDIAKTELMRERLVVAKQVEDGYLSYATGMDDLELARLTLDAARDGEKLASVQYRLGLIKPLELFDSETRLRNAEADYLTAVYDLHLAKSGLRFATGGGF